MEPGCDGDVDLHESWYWSVSLCANVGGSGGGGGGAVVVHVDGADGVVSDGGIGSAVGNGFGDNGGNVGGSWSCGSGIESSGGGFVVVVLENFRVVL